MWRGCFGLLSATRNTSRVVWNIMGGWILSIAIFFLSHTIACLWYLLRATHLSFRDLNSPLTLDLCKGICVAWSRYYVGTITQEANHAERTPGLTGWVERIYGPSCGDQQDALSAPPPPPPPVYLDVGGADVDSIGGWSEAVPFDLEACYEADRTSRYITSVYWALMTISTVGYGDITALTDAEKIASSFTMLFGALVFAGITGQMASRFMASKGAVQTFNTRMDEIRQYLRDKNVPTTQRRAIEQHFILLWGKTAIYDEAEILTLLPRTLRDPLMETLYVERLSHVAIFSGLGRFPRGREVLGLIAQQLTTTVANFGLIVMKDGEYGHETFFIEEGEVDIYQHNSASRQKLSGAVSEHDDFRNGLGVR